MRLSVHRLSPAAARLPGRRPPGVRRRHGADVRDAGARKRAPRRSSVATLWIQAIADARRRSGGCERAAQAARDALGGPAGRSPPDRRWRFWMHAFRQDIKYAFRVLAKQPGRHVRRDPDARARHRRELGDLLRRQRRPAAAAALRRSRSDHDGLGEASRRRRHGQRRRAGRLRRLGEDEHELRGHGGDDARCRPI